MGDFFEKLKKGMGIEEIKIEKEEKKESLKKKPLPKIESKNLQPKKEGFIPQEITSKKEVKEKEELWPEPEGQLVVDIYQTETDLFIQSPIAGIKAEDLDIEIQNDLFIIRGERKNPVQEKVDYFSQECYWGKFSRQIILPVEIDPNRIEASFKEGILTIKMPKLLKEKKRKIIPKES